MKTSAMETSATETSGTETSGTETAAEHTVAGNTVAGNTIVVGIDGSAGSLEALHWATEEATVRAAVVEAVTCWEYPYWYTGIPDGDMSMPVDTIKEAAADTLEHAIEKVVAEPERRSSIRRSVINGHPSDVLRELSKTAELVVVGARGQRGFLGALLGSTADQLVRHGACPIVVVRGVTEN
jgi:nucleotide-binding universal stress UspA family protein